MVLYLSAAVGGGTMTLEELVEDEAEAEAEDDDAEGFIVGEPAEFRRIGVGANEYGLIGGSLLDASVVEFFLLGGWMGRQSVSSSSSKARREADARFFRLCCTVVSPET